MPNRILRDGIIESERVNKLSPCAELFYRRLMSKADDFGRFHANLNLLLAACYPLQLDRVSLTNVREWLTECGEEPPLLIEYSDQNKKYLEIINFGQRTRSAQSKFPDPPLTNVRESRTTAARASNTSPSPPPYTSPNTSAEFVDKVLSQAIPPEELAAAYQRHHKRVNGEPLHAVKDCICRMASFDLARFRDVHPEYCAYWDSRDWNFSTLTLLGWIRADMPMPPPVVDKASTQKEPSSERLIRVMEERVKRTGSL